MWILVNGLAFLLYLSTAFIGRPRAGSPTLTALSLRRRNLSTVAMALAWLAHASTFVLVLEGMHEPDFGFAPALSLTFWLVAAVYWVESLYYPLQGLRSWICLLAAVSLLLTWFFPPYRVAPAGAGIAFSLHWALGIAAYGLIGAAVLHGFMLWSAERALHQRRPGLAGLGPALPLLTLEKLTYRLATLGFLLLSASLVFAMLFSARLFGQPFELNHQTVFGVASWLLFAVLLLGRHVLGWRGRRALRWLFSGSALLLLSYVGSRFVLQVILHR
ncbi:MAG: cytochrome c biogenesis protein CcsA [Betaproteobacteria bacterium]|nr:cytochrome c biogenesis protein CcsA [Betaproteobacteria bacterium]